MDKQSDATLVTINIFIETVVNTTWAINREACDSDALREALSKFIQTRGSSPFLINILQV